MKIGDMVEVRIPEVFPGALTAVKFFNRLIDKTGKAPGIIVEDHGATVSVLFGENVHIVSKRHVRIIDHEEN